jgi:hypothetical protein
MKNEEFHQKIQLIKHKLRNGFYKSDLLGTQEARIENEMKSHIDYRNFMNKVLKVPT